MARVKLTEYRAKKLLLGEAYHGIALGKETREKMPTKGRWVIKVDEGMKKRMKRGLVVVDCSPKEASLHIAKWKKKGFSRFLVEPLVPHNAAEEKYFSLERVRGGFRLLYGQGGIDVEKDPDAIHSLVLASREDMPKAAKVSGVSESFLTRVIELFDGSHVAFFEINPLVAQGEAPYPLDAAVLVDDAGLFFAKGAWNESDLVRGVRTHPTEKAVARLQQTTPASLKLTVLNPDGALFFLLSGGGASIVAADEAALLGAGTLLGNYGEYSGGPSREETYLYAKELIGLLLASHAKKKALVIAGGVANFTDVAETFAGIIDALSETSRKLREAGIRIFVRRGGPNEKVGLQMMSDFLKKERLFGAVYGSETPITQPVDEAVASIQP